jgi:hypothetical protein
MSVAAVGLRPCFSAHVRSGERGAPVVVFAVVGLMEK